ncbi:MAG: hypothetical protein D6705_07560 [Deltaproteobacteria bacterium]|nr:MAG: hypothetical protein D6705_07560 [Deltaproteobacteria bacterium]
MTLTEPICFDQRTPAARGEAHGAMFRREIRELARIRTELCLVRGAFGSVDVLRAVAAAHLPVLEAFDADLSAELHGIARAAEIDPVDLVILNHYTDLRDVPPSVLGGVGGSDPGGCTAVYTDGLYGPVLGQTWDMHGTAAPFVRVFRFDPPDGPETVCFSLTGCLGMAGISGTGVAVTINNLASTDAQVGVVWPALVRRMLAQPDAEAARDLLLGTRLSSGHHYMIADGTSFFGVECSGRRKAVTQRGAKASFLHTNHCFDPSLRAVERVHPSSTTFRRMELASTLFVQMRPKTLEDLWALLSSHEGYPRSICSHVDDAAGDPSASRTCGAIAMALCGGRVLATAGCLVENPPAEIRIRRWQGRPEIPYVEVEP